MNAIRRWARWGAWVLAAGGPLWVLKVAFIASNDAIGRDRGASPVPMIYLSAVVLLAVDAAALRVAFLRSLGSARI